MAQIGDLAHGVGQPALVERLQEQVPDIGMGLFEFVEQDDRERLLAHAADQRVGLDGRRRTLAEDLADRFMSLEFAHVEADHPLDRAEQKFRDRLGELGLAGAGRPGEQKHADRLVGIVQPGLEHGDARDHGLDRFVLADHACSEKVADRLEIELLPGVEHRDRQAGELR